jgi:hypothetical protein
MDCKRIVAALLLSATSCVCRTRAQSATLPATPQTAQATPSSAPRSVAAKAAPVNHNARVIYASGQLQVTADGSSMNQILRDISVQTGMKITGNAVEERVYGTYGPASPDKVLQSLIEGTGINMVLKESADDHPAELTLTPRNGALIPATPYTSGGLDVGSHPYAPMPPGRPSAPPPPRVYSSAPMAVTPTEPPPVPPADDATPPTPPDPTATSGTQGAASSGPPPQAATPAADPTATANDAPASPNGVKTPQQIYMQLQQMQQQQQASPGR